MTHDDLFQKLLGNHSRSWCGDIFFWVSNNNFLRRFLITDIGEDRSEYFPDPGITIFFSLETGLSRLKYMVNYTIPYIGGIVYKVAF